jgi:hypothetical protein
MSTELARQLLTVALALLEPQAAEQPAACVASDPLVRFIETNAHQIPGAKTTFGEFHRRFNAWSKSPISKIALARRLKQLLPVGTASANVLMVGNLSFDRRARPDRPYRAVGGKLRQLSPDSGIAFEGKRYSVTVAGRRLGLYPTRAAAIKARDEYLARG